MKSRSPSCSDSNIASGRTGRSEGLLSVPQIVPEVFPCGMGGSLIITTPLVALARRPRLRRLQRKLRPIAPSRVTGGCLCLRGSYKVCAVIGLPTLAPMPPAPSRLPILGGSCRIHSVRLRNRLRGYSLRSGGKVTTASGVKLLRQRRKITPPVNSPEGLFCRASIRLAGRVALPRSEYRRPRRPPMLQMPFPFQRYFLLSLHECR